MKYLVLFSLLLGGCAAPSVELRRVAEECGEGEECKPLWDSYMKKLEHEDKQLRSRNITCPPGMIKVTDGWERSSCYSRTQVDSWLRGRMY